MSRLLMLRFFLIWIFFKKKTFTEKNWALKLNLYHYEKPKSIKTIVFESKCHRGGHRGGKCKKVSRIIWMTYTWGQFHPHFTCAFFVWKQISQLFYPPKSNSKLNLKLPFSKLNFSMSKLPYSKLVFFPINLFLKISFKCFEGARVILKQLLCHDLLNWNQVN